MIKKLARISTYFLALFFLGLALWTNKFFGKVTFDQVLSTFYFSFKGGIAGDSTFTKRFLSWCILWPAIITAVIVNFHHLFRFIRYLRAKLFSGRLIKYRHYFPYLLLISCIAYALHQFDIPNYIKYHSNPFGDYFAENYLPPEKVKITAKHPKSLLLIYVESLETTYADTNLFRTDLLQRLDKINVQHTTFNQYEQMPGTNWTIAGLVSTQCGLPLKLVTMLNNNRMGEETAHFLPRATCLSDILSKNGYRNIFMNGPDNDFAGVGNFLKDHHYDEIYGRNEWLKNGVAKESDMTGWGLPDDMLLQQVKIKLRQLIQSNQPFNLTVLTVDTHGLSGQLSKTCAKQGYSNFEGIVECTANMVADLIHYSDKKGWLDKMDIVVVGDHLAMKNLAYHDLAKAKHRYLFNMIISKDSLHKNTNKVVHFDFLPTILTTLGFQIEGSHLGLGYSAVGAKPIIDNEKRIAEMQKKIPYTSKTYNQLWLEK